MVRIGSVKEALKSLKLNRSGASVSIKTFDAKCFFVLFYCKTANISNLIPLIFEFLLNRKFEDSNLKV